MSLLVRSRSSEFLKTFGKMRKIGADSLPVGSFGLVALLSRSRTVVGDVSHGRSPLLVPHDESWGH